MWMIPYYSNAEDILDGSIAQMQPIIIETIQEEKISEPTQSDEDLMSDITEQPRNGYVKEYISYQVPSNSGFKSYMEYTVFSSSSSQHRLQQIAVTGQYGIRMVNGRFCSAIGTHFFGNASIGQYFDIVLENGTIIECVLADVKSDAHTDANHIMTVHNGCVSEFVVDKSQLHDMARQMGNVSYVDDSWQSPVVEIRMYNINALN